ncbi:hematopoietic progenitor cell antigen CD34 [Pelodytes ibericus]
MMLSCHLRAVSKWQTFCCLLSILTLLDASDVSTVLDTSSQTGSVSPRGSTAMPEQQTTKHLTVSTFNPSTVNTTDPSTSLGISNTAALEDSHFTTTINTTIHLGTRIAESSVTNTCVNLKNQASTSNVVCIEYHEKINCENLNTEQENKLKNILCQDSTSVHCNITVFSSEVNPQCILWMPSVSQGKALQDIKNKFENNNQNGIQLKWGHVSDHQTRSQKTMIALITCGILFAILIVAGYYLSNTTRWSPGRQRLGEDPYYTETDSQGNTLVSVTTHGQDKSNSGTRENGKGQAITPNSTNGHSTKKPTVSDTEL